MNVADTEIINGILDNQGYRISTDLLEADAIFLNTCAIRDNAEQRIYGRLENFHHLKKKNPHLVFGILGCMAERLRKNLIEEKKIVDIVCGPDEYRKLPALIDTAFEGEKGIKVQLSRVETYDDITPLRTDGISAWISVMRGCDKFCTFCVVPFTRGRERSRTRESIVREVESLVARGFKEITLLGQNVNSYSDGVSDFGDLLASVARIDSSLRVRYTTSHPSDMSDKLIETMAAHPNICKYIHLPIQSGSDRILDLMNRSYTVDQYLNRIAKLRALMPEIALSTDVIAGFPTETEEDHRQTLEVMRAVEYDGAFMFKYSPRENTKAFEMENHIADEIASKRLEEIIAVQREISYHINKRMIDREEIILIESTSKRSSDEMLGRTDGNKTVIVPKGLFEVGDYIRVRIHSATSATLFGTFLGYTSESKAA